METIAVRLPDEIISEIDLYVLNLKKSFPMMNITRADAIRELINNSLKNNNSENFIIISQNVKITDIKGTMLAEKLIFDIEKNTLEISSLEDDKVYTNLKRK